MWIFCWEEKKREQCNSSWGPPGLSQLHIWQGGDFSTYQHQYSFHPHHILIDLSSPAIASSSRVSSLSTLQCTVTSTTSRSSYNHLMLRSAVCLTTKDMGLGCHQVKPLLIVKIMLLTVWWLPSWNYHQVKRPKSSISTDDALNEVSMTTMPGRVVSKTWDCARLQTGWRIGLPPTKLIGFLQT